MVKDRWTNASRHWSIITPFLLCLGLITGTSAVGQVVTSDEWATPPPEASAAQSGIYVATSAHTTGYGGAFWMTDLEIHNPGKTAVAYEIALLKKDTANTAPDTKSFTIQPGTSTRFEDPLLSLFNFTGSAALRVTPMASGPAPAVGHDAAALGPAYNLLVTSRTFNNQPGGKTFGQFVPGYWDTAAITYAYEGRLIELTHNPAGIPLGDRESVAASGYRTNIGAVNTSAETIQIEIVLYLADGTKVDTRTLDLRAYEYKQIDKVFGSTDVPDGYAILRLKSEKGSFLCYASVIDNQTGDPIYVPASKFERTDLPPAFTAITFGTKVDANYNISDPGTAFPAGTKTVYYSYSYFGLVAGAPYKLLWYFNNVKTDTIPYTAYGSSGSSTGSRTISSGWSSGAYKLEITYEDKVMSTGQFTIGP